MTAFKDVTVTDLAGAAEQWRAYITGTLGFDHDITVQVAVSNGRGEIYVRGCDKFQEHLGYGEGIGRCAVIEHFDLTHDWDAACKLVWKRLEKAMQRDERELRYGLKAMSGAIEHAGSFTSHVGKMFAERIIAVRDDVGKHLIEFRRQPQPAE